MSVAQLDQIPQPAALSFSGSLNPIRWILDEATKSIEKELEKLANKADLVARDIILAAGQQLLLVIESLKGAYQESLDKTYDKVDQLMRDSIDKVQNLVDDVIQREEEALLHILDRIEDIAVGFPFSNGSVPLLREATPHFFAVDGDPNDVNRPFSTQVTVIFKGRFPYADRYPPTFTVSGKEYQPTDNSNRELQFRINVSSTDPKVRMHKYSYLSGVLQMDWKSGWWPWPFPRDWSWTTSKYNMSLGMLPASPGKVTALFTKAASQLPKQGRSYYPYDGTHPQLSHHHGDKFKTEQVDVVPSPGWHIATGSSHWEWKTGNGRKHYAKLLRDEPDKAIWEYSIEKGFVGTFQIDFQEYQTVPESKRVQQIDNLRWGSSDLFSPERGETITMIAFEAFNGDSFKFPVPLNGPFNPSNPLIELRRGPNGSIQIQAKKASAIDTTSIESLTAAIHQQRIVDQFIHPELYPASS